MKKITSFFLMLIVFLLLWMKTFCVTTAPAVSSAADLRRNTLIIHVRWENEDNIIEKPLTGKQIHDLVFNPNTRSANNYYMELFGKSENIIVPATVTNPLNGYQGIVEVTLTGLSGRHRNPDNSSAEQIKVLYDAIAAVDPYIDFSRYATGGIFNNTLRQEDLVIGVIVHGYEESMEGDEKPLKPNYWAVEVHSPIGISGPNVGWPIGPDLLFGTYELANFGIRDGVRINCAFGLGAYHDRRTPMTIGVFCHEFGHAAYGFYDTYDYGLEYNDEDYGDDDDDIECSGQGHWSLMANQHTYQRWEKKGDSPPYVDAYNLVVRNIVTPGVISQITSDNIRMNTHLDIYKVTTTNKNQYFLLQQRKYGTESNYDRGAFYTMAGEREENPPNPSDGGLLIYHIDESVIWNPTGWSSFDPLIQWFADGYINDKDQHMRAGIEEAHGDTQLLQTPWHMQESEYKGSVSDLWGWNTLSGKDRFYHDSNPSSGLYSEFTRDNVKPNQDTRSGVDIAGIKWNFAGGFTELNGKAPEPITDIFLDKNFLAAVRQAINKPVGDIEAIDVARITNLNVSNRGIESLAGLEYFTSLTTLNCSGNFLMELPELPNDLMYLYCQNNKLDDLPALPPSLYQLICSGNGLTSLSEMPPNLSILICADNALDSLPITLPSSLWWLDCSNNQLTSLPETLPSGLRYLYCSDNYLTSLPALTNLFELNCSNNQLTMLPGTLPSSLWRLYCQFNRLRTIPRLPTGLLELNCSNNLIALLDVTGLTELTDLNCTYNYMTAPSNVTGFTRVWDNNNFRYNPQSSIITGSISDLGFRAAVYEAIDKAGPEPIYDTDVWEITELDLSNRGISNLDGLENFRSLEVLDCSGNRLTSLDVTRLTALYSLNCANNDMANESNVTGFTGTNISFNFHPQNTPAGAIVITGDFVDVNFSAALRDLLGKTESEPIFNTDVSWITKLNVSNQNIESLEGLENFTSLTTLFCWGNQLVSLPEALPPSLKVISCESNKLTSLSGLPSGLTTLYCYNNQLTSLDVTSLTVLTTLDCSYNVMQNSSAVTGFAGADNDISFYPQISDIKDITEDFTDPVFRDTVYWLIGKTDESPIYNINVELIETLSVSHRDIQSLEGIQHFTNLKELLCNNNLLTSLPALPHGITKLNCYDNQLRSLDVTGLTELVYLDCTGNYILSPDSVVGWSELGLTINSLEDPDIGTFLYYDQLIPQYTITVSFGIGGDVTGGGEFEHDSIVLLKALPKSGYSFDGWYEGTIKVSGLSEYSFVASANRTLEARFMPISIHEYPVFTDGKGNVLEHLTAQELVTTLSMCNDTGQVQKLTMYVAVYFQSGKLVYVESDAKEIGVGETVEFRVQINMPDNIGGVFASQGYYSNVFVWDSVTFAPATEKYVFPITERNGASS